MADPDESVQPLYRERLVQEGFELATASSGLECVARLRESVPDVLVLEPQLPWGGGEGVLAMMGELPQLANVPVMVLTSCRDPRLLEAIARFPVSDYQLKPLAAERLVGRLRTILAHPKLRFTLAEQSGRLECSIARRTGGRVRDLRVETVDGRVIVRGRSDSHHVKQLRWPPCGKRLKPRSRNPKGSSWTSRLRRLMDGRPGDVPYPKQGMGIVQMNALSQERTNRNVRHICKCCLVFAAPFNEARTSKYRPLRSQRVEQSEPQSRPNVESAVPQASGNETTDLKQDKEKNKDRN